MSHQPQENPVLKLGPNPAGQVLYFFGTRHTNDPEDKQFKQIKKLFEEFLSQLKKEKVVFVEGITNEIPQDYEESIREYGEAGGVKWLARKASINVMRPEPSDEEQRKLLCALFDPKLVAYTVIIQNLASWFRHTSQTSFDKAISRVLSREVKFSDIYRFAPDRLWFDDHHKQLFGEQKLEDKQFLDSISDPRKNDSVVNNVVASRSKLRNEYILSVIKKSWKYGNSIFIVYGKGHLVSLEKDLKKLE